MMNPAITTVGELADLIEKRLNRSPLVVGDTQRKLETIGWCTGAAQDLLPGCRHEECEHIPEW